MSAPGERLSEEERADLIALLPGCTQCGQKFDHRACGPTHAIIAADPGRHRLLAPLLLAQREEIAQALLNARGLHFQDRETAARVARGAS